jgi:predicted signal transduction protein with EAL and GGDEF domain
VLFRAADTALSEAKREGSSGLAFFDTEMANRMRRRTSLERDLRQHWTATNSLSSISRKWSSLPGRCAGMKR